MREANDRIKLLIKQIVEIAQYQMKLNQIKYSNQNYGTVFFIIVNK